MRAWSRGSAVVAALMVLGVGTLGAPAQARTRVQEGDALDAMIALESEVAALVRLDAFPGTVPQRLLDVEADWRSSLEGMSRPELLEWVHNSENEAAVYMGRLGESNLSTDARNALRRLPPESVSSVEGGGPITVPADVYERALNDLQYRNGAAPGAAAQSADPADPGGAAPAGPVTSPPVAQVTSPPATTPRSAGSIPASSPAGAGRGTGAAPSDPGAPTDGTSGDSPGAAPGATTGDGSGVVPGSEANSASSTSERDPASSGSDGDGDAGNRGSDGSGSSLGLIVAIVVALLLLAATAIVFLRRRGRTPRSGGIEGSVAGLLDAGRRLGSSIDAVEIHRILVEEAAALTGATAAALVTLDGATPPVPVVVAETSDGTVLGPHLTRGAVRRVLDTGVGLRSVIDDPAVGEGPQAMVIVPLVRNGAIAGTVIVTRPPDRPFDAGALDLLGQLVPMAAAALVSAGLHDNVAELSLTDGLTELGNRRRLDRDLAAALGAGAGTVGFVMVDIDHFKQFNDTHGHVAGDGVLQTVARLLRDSVRGGDVVYRYGGEEFCVLLPDATAVDAAEVSERLRGAIESHDFPGGESQPGGRLTISVGTTVASRTDPVAIKERADHALYEAKHLGRNRVVVDESAGP